MGNAKNSPKNGLLVKKRTDVFLYRYLETSFSRSMTFHSWVLPWLESIRPEDWILTILLIVFLPCLNRRVEARGKLKCWVGTFLQGPGNPAVSRQNFETRWRYSHLPHRKAGWVWVALARAPPLIHNFLNCSSLRFTYIYIYIMTVWPFDRSETASNKLWLPNLPHCSNGQSTSEMGPLALEQHGAI